MPSFDVVSEVDMQEVKNAVDQTAREIATRFDFKNTGSSIELTDQTIEMNANSEGRLDALRQVLEEKFVKRKLSLKSLDYGKVEDASKGAARQKATIVMGITTEKAKEIGKFLKEKAPKGVAHQIQGDKLRVNGKKRDDLQASIALLKEADFGIPLQYENFRD